MAVAAATAGETRWVRPPRPWRPSKLRLLVDARPLADGELVRVHGQAHRAARLAPVEAGGGEHLVEALGLGLLLAPVPTRARPALARRRRTWRPSATAAAARRSSMRQLVQEPMKTVSTWMSRIGVPGLEAHVGQRPLGGLPLVRLRRSRRGSGTAAVERHDLGGVGPPGHVGRRGRRRRARPPCRSRAPSSVGSDRQSSSARSQSAPVGA